VPLPRSANTIVVLDLSASISSDTFSRIGGTLSALARSGNRFGLVLFSDDAYEALPPGMPGADLLPFVRYFTVPAQTTPGFLPTFPTNPWTSSFTAGTRISAGMALAQKIAVRSQPPATIILVSDLDDDPGDIFTLAAVLSIIRHDRIPVRIVGLNPLPQNAALFERLLGPTVPVVEAPTLEQVPPHDRTPFPWRLLELAVASAAALAVLATWAPRLAWRTA